MNDENISTELVEDLSSGSLQCLENLLRNKNRIELVGLAWTLARQAVELCPALLTVNEVPALQLIVPVPGESDGLMAKESYKDVQTMLRIQAKWSSYQETIVTSKLLTVPGYHMALIVGTLGDVNVFLLKAWEEEEEEG